jgi:hypothetical protein
VLKTQYHHIARDKQPADPQDRQTGSHFLAHSASVRGEQSQAQLANDCVETGVAERECAENGIAGSCFSLTTKG